MKFVDKTIVFLTNILLRLPCVTDIQLFALFTSFPSIRDEGISLNG